MIDRLKSIIKIFSFLVITTMMLIPKVFATSLYDTSYRSSEDIYYGDFTKVSSTPILMKSIGIVFLVCFVLYQIKVGFVDKNNDYKRTSISSLIMAILFYLYAFRNPNAGSFILLGIALILLLIYNEIIFINRQKKAFKFRNLADNPIIYATLSIIAELLVLDIPFNKGGAHKVIAIILSLLFFAFYALKIKNYYPRYKKLKNGLESKGEK